jgi:hypothetical protein
VTVQRQIVGAARQPELFRGPLGNGGSQLRILWDPPQVHRYPSGGQAGVRDVRFMGLFDERDRLLAVATHNTDIADGWEREGESREFFERFSVRPYAMGINILFYAMTH